MKNEDKRDFGNLLVSVLELHGRSPSKNVLALWWASLVKYDYQTVLAGMSALVQDPVAGKYPPTPAAVIGAIWAADGRPSADEAWAIAVASFDESATCCVSTEIMIARNVAVGLHGSGDDYGARQAFVAAYDSATREAREAGHAPKWTLSIGHDPARRQGAVQDALDRGRISADVAKHLLPAPPATGIPSAVAGLITGKVVQFPESDDAKTRQRLSELRKALGGAK